MFERYSERARRVLFFARYEAAQAGALSIEPEHIVLGVLRDKGNALVKFARPGETADSIRTRLASASVPRERVSASVEIPFSPSCKELLTQTAAEADALKKTTIRPGHMILAIMAKGNGAAARALHDAGVDPNTIREHLRGVPDDTQTQESILTAHGTMLSGYAASGVVIRQWKGVVKPGLADAYIRHLQRETLPALSRLEGFGTVTILRREIDDGTEFQVTTLWRSLDAIKAFAGEDVTRAVVPPAAQALMVRYDDRAVHYDIVA
jgi:heme-degrading monooxygenase HmoA